jgi:hypothetical protein
MARPLIFVALIGGIAAWVAVAWPSGPAPDREPHAGQTEDDADYDWFVPEVLPPPSRPSGDGRPTGVNPLGEGVVPTERARPGRRDTQRFAGDAGTGGAERRTQRSRNARRVLDRITVEAAEGETELSAEDVLNMLGQMRGDARDCMREQGIDSSEWRTARRSDRSLAFEVDASGRVVPTSIAVDPPFPPAIQECFVQALGTAQPPGEGGNARVAVELPGVDGRRFRDRPGAGAFGPRGR